MNRPSTLRARGALENPITRNAASLFGTTVVTSGLGFAFWVAAARFYPAESVGAASAAVSAMQLLATFGLVGLGTLIIGEAASRRSSTGLISAAAAVAATASACLAVATVLLAQQAHIQLGGLDRGWWRTSLFVVGVAVTAWTLIVDQACIGLNRGRLQLRRNAVFSVVKLVILPLGVLAGGADAAPVIFLLWSLGNLSSVAVFVRPARRLGRALTPDLRMLASLRSAALAHHWLNVAAVTPRLVLPVLVASMLNPALNAAFYTAMLLVSLPMIIPAHMATALFALPRGDRSELAHQLTRSLKLCLVISVGSVAIFSSCGWLMLSFFGNDYRVAYPSLIFLSLSILPFTVKTHYAAVCRVRGTLTWCAAVSTAGGALELTLAAIGAMRYGLNGVGAGFLIAMTVEAGLILPGVARAAKGHSTQGALAGPTSASSIVNAAPQLSVH